MSDTCRTGGCFNTPAVLDWCVDCAPEYWLKAALTAGTILTAEQEEQARKKVGRD